MKTLTYHQKKAVEKVEQILKGALPVFLQYGYTGASMDKVAETAGVSKQTIYSHFGDKEGLFKALIEQVAKEKYKLVWAKPLQGKPKIVLKELAYRILEEVNHPEHLAFMHLIISEAKNDPDLGKIFLANVAKPAIVILTDYLQQNSELSLKNPSAIARIYVGSLIHFVLTQEMLHGKGIIPMSPDELIDTLIDLIIHPSEVKD